MQDEFNVMTSDRYDRMDTTVDKLLMYMGLETERERENIVSEMNSAM